MIAVLDKDFLHFSQASLRRTLPDFRDEKTAIFAGNRPDRRSRCRSHRWLQGHRLQRIFAAGDMNPISGDLP
jgi:hypothetical protein